MGRKTLTESTNLECQGIGQKSRDKCLLLTVCILLYMFGDHTSVYYTVAAMWITVAATVLRILLRIY